MGCRRLVEFQDNVDPTVRRVHRPGVECLGALAQILDGLAHRGIGEVDPRHDQFIQLAIDRLGSAGDQNRLFDHRSRAEVGATDRSFPCFVNLRDHGGTGVVVSIVSHPHLGHANLLHPATGRHIVAIDAEYRLVFGGRFVEARRVIESLALVEQGFYFLDSRHETRSNRLVEVVGRFQPREQALGRFVIGIVLRLQKNADRFLCVLPATFLDPRLGQAHDRLGKTVQSHGAKFTDAGCVGQSIDRRFVLGVGGLVVPLHQGHGPPLHGLRGVVLGQLQAFGNFQFGLRLDTGKGGSLGPGAGIKALGQSRQDQKSRQKRPIKDCWWFRWKHPWREFERGWREVESSGGYLQNRLVLIPLRHCPRQ